MKYDPIKIAAIIWCLGFWTTTILLITHGG